MISLSSLLKSSYTQQVFTGTKNIPVVVPIAPKLESLNENIDSIELRVEEERALALEECKRMKEQAERDAMKLLEDARTQAIAIADEARSEGYNAGFENGRIEAQSEFAEKYNSIITAAEKLVCDIEDDRTRRLREISEVVVQLTMESIRTLLSRELELEEPNIEAVVSDLIQYVIESTRIEVRVHPADAKSAMTAHPKWVGMKFGDWEVVIVPDLHVGRGGCEIRSHLGRVDAKIDTELELLEEAIRKIINETMAGEEQCNQ